MGGPEDNPHPGLKVEGSLLVRDCTQPGSWRIKGVRENFPSGRNSEYRDILVWRIWQAMGAAVCFNIVRAWSTGGGGGRNK
jgi:hypothetical protein